MTRRGPSSRARGARGSPRSSRRRRSRRTRCRRRAARGTGGRPRSCIPSARARRAPPAPPPGRPRPPAAPDRVELDEPAEQVAPDAPATCHPLVQVVVGIHEPRGDEVAVTPDRLVPRLLGHRPDRLDPAVADGDVAGPPRSSQDRPHGGERRRSGPCHDASVHRNRRPGPRPARRDAGRRPRGVHPRLGRSHRARRALRRRALGRAARRGRRPRRSCPAWSTPHVHVNEPGRTEWEGFETATRAAAAGGVTTIVDMPLNSIPPTTTVEALAEKRAAAAGKAHVDVGFWGGAVPDNLGRPARAPRRGRVRVQVLPVPVGRRRVRIARARAARRRRRPSLAAFDGPLLVHAELPEPIEPRHDGSAIRRVRYRTS